MDSLQSRQWCSSEELLESGFHILIHMQASMSLFCTLALCRKASNLPAVPINACHVRSRIVSVVNSPVFAHKLRAWGVCPLTKWMCARSIRAVNLV